MADDQSNPPPPESETIQAGRPADAPRPEPFDRGHPPRTLGRYVIERSLGTGYGQVLRQDRAAASGRGQGPQRRAGHDAERRSCEARRLAQLRHRIVTVHEWRADGDLRRLRPSRGPSLHQWVIRSGSRGRQVVAEIADALGTHARATIHRDVKPENVIMADGRGPVLIDFGLGLEANRRSSGGGSRSGTYR